MCLYHDTTWLSTPALTASPWGAKPWHFRPHSLPLIKTTGHFALFFRPSLSHGLSGKSIMCIKSTCINSPPVGWARTPQERRQRIEPQLYWADTHSDDLQASLPFLSFSLSFSVGEAKERVLGGWCWLFHQIPNAWDGAAEWSGGSGGQNSRAPGVA